MMHRKFLTFAATAAAAVLMSATGAQAVQSTQGFTAATSTTRDGSSYTIQGWTSTAGQTGGFLAPTAYPITNFGNLTFDVSSSTGDLSFGTAAFGTFTSTSVQTIADTSAGAIYYFLGTWAPGTVSPDPVAGPASLSITTSVNGSTISSSGTLAVPPLPIPEPSSVALGLTSLVIGGLAHGLRRRRAGK